MSIRSSSEVAARGVSKRNSFATEASADVILLLVMLAAAIGSGSHTLLGQTIRSMLILLTGVWSFMVLAKATRDSGQRYQFGAGKLEQAGNMTIALALTVTGLALAGWAFDLIVVGEGKTEPLGLAVAATANAVFTVRAGLALWTHAMVTAGKEPTPGSLQWPVTMSGFVSLLIVQLVLTVAALARDPAIALAADCLGAMLVAVLMTAAGIRMLRDAVLDLVDHPLRGKDQEAIARLLLEEGVDSEELIDMRSRRSGRHVFVEVTMDPVEAGSLEEIRRRLARVRRRLEDRLAGLDVSIRLHAP